MRVQSGYFRACKAPVATFTVKVGFPPNIAIPAQTRQGFATRHEAEIWLDGIKHALCDRYGCSERVLVRKGFQFLVVVGG